MSEHRTEWQTEIILREMWINLLAGDSAAHAIAHGASGEEVMQAIDDVAQKLSVAVDCNSRKPLALAEVHRTTAEALQRGAPVAYIKRRVADLLWRSGTLSQQQLSKLMGLNRSGFLKMCDDMKAAQKAALILSVDPKTAKSHGITVPDEEEDARAMMRSAMATYERAMTRPLPSAETLLLILFQLADLAAATAPAPIRCEGGIPAFLKLFARQLFQHTKHSPFRMF